jgi:hypothetical protein
VDDVAAVGIEHADQEVPLPPCEHRARAV